MRFDRTIDLNLARIERLLNEATRQRTDAVLFPECAVTGYDYDFSALRRAEIREALTAVGRMAAARRVNLLIGSPVFAGRKLYNCLVVFGRGGHVVHCYAKCQLTPDDQQHFAPGDAIGLFAIDGVTATTVICHERRYPELVRLAVMAGAQILFHPNAGMDRLSVSRAKRGGRDGVAVRAMENAIYYVFANSVGPQGGGKWSAGDSKIVGPDERVLKQADNQSESVLVARLDLSKATRRYALRSMEHPRFLHGAWRAMVRAVRQQAARSRLPFDLPEPS
jgi:predicted amidohydrolase